jgi:hypothetical protein
MYQQGEERRPGSRGRRYFSDSIYAKTPEANLKPPTLEEAEKTSKKQALILGGMSEADAEAQVNPVAEEPVTAATGGYLRKMAAGGLASGSPYGENFLLELERARSEKSEKMAAGGLASASSGYYLGGKTDGMADNVPANIDGNQEARLSDGEFVVPADVVSHLGNGNSDAGAEQLHGMMNNVRQARTGTPEQGKQIDPKEFLLSNRAEYNAFIPMPKMAQGGLAQFNSGGSVYKNQPYKTNFQEGDTVVGPTDSDGDGIKDVEKDEAVNLPIGTESSLSSWVGPYATDMLAKGWAESETPYEAYEGPLTAGTSELQSQALTGIGALNNPMSSSSVTRDMGAFTPDAATLDPYMNPYTSQVIDRTSADMQRQSDIQKLQDRTAQTQSGAFGGSRQALMDAERFGTLNRNIGDMAATQRAQGFESAMDRAKAGQEMANQYGFDVLGAQAKAGETQRGIASEGIAADYGQFREERDYDAKRIQYMQSLLQGLPLAAQSTTYSEPSEWAKLLEGEAAAEEMWNYANIDDSGDTSAAGTVPVGDLGSWVFDSGAGTWGWVGTDYDDLDDDQKIARDAANPGYYDA